MRKFNKIFFLLFCLFLLVNLGLPVLAVDIVEQQTTQLNAAAGSSGADFGASHDPRLIAAYTIQILMGTMGIIFIAYMVYAGYLILLSGGNEEKVTQGRKVIFQAVLGVLITFSAFGIATFTARYLKEATTTELPTGFYAGAGYEIDRSTDQFFTDDPLQQDTGVMQVIPGGQATTW